MAGATQQLNVTFTTEDRLVAFTKERSATEAFLGWLEAMGCLLEADTPDDDSIWTCRASCSVEAAREWFSSSTASTYQ
jgi:hypothetical protein